MANKIRNFIPKLLACLTGSDIVAVLLFVSAVPVAVCANDDVSGADIRLFEFTSGFYMPMGNGRIDGLMASDGHQHRIAIYWIEPAVYRDHTFFLGFGDFIFGEDRVHYWIHGVPEHGTFDLFGGPADQLLPGNVSPESVARCAVAIANRTRSEPEQGDAVLEVGEFFRKSRGQSDYSYEVTPGRAGSDRATARRASDVDVLNALPFGRRYSKQIQSDGGLIWHAQTVLDGPHVARVTVKPVSLIERDDDGSTFDPDTLGRWARVPEAYRTYWLFDKTYLELKDAPDDDTPGRELHDKIESYLDTHKVPDKVRPALSQLLFKTAMLSGDLSRILRSAQSAVTALCRDDSASKHQGLLELARLDAQIREQYPDKADDLVRPLIGQKVSHNGPDAGRDIERFMPTIESNRWFRYGELLVEQARSQALVEEDVAETLNGRLKAARLAIKKPPADPCEAVPSVKLYLAQIDSDPPAGTLSMDDVRDILKQGLGKPLGDAKLNSIDKTVEDTVRSIRLIAGDGPFRGDRAKLIDSVERFSGLYLVVFGYTEPIDTVLATFLALSFCDTSRAEDHDTLFSQIRKLCGQFQSLTNSMLAERGLGDMVVPADVERVFSMYERRFHGYIDDPLWPAFKFPLTADEETRLRNKLKQRFGQLEPLLDDMSLKVRYGGPSEELKEKILHNLSLAAQQLLPQSAFLRKPPYPGVSCRYRGAGYGFTAVIRGQLYKEGERPREKFKAMKYFHMGHRLEEVVKRERELPARR